MIINIIFILLLVVLCVAIFRFFAKKSNGLYTNILLFGVSIVHFFIFVYRFFYLNIDAGDSRRFYDVASQSTDWFSLFGIGNKSMPFLLYPFVKTGISYFSLSLLFSILSFMGYLIYFKILTKNISNKTLLEKTLIALFFIIPSLHFWTVSISKEAIIFLLMALVFEKINNLKFSNLNIIASIVIILFIRPYLAAILMFPLIILNFKNFSFKYKIIITSILAVSVPVILNFLRISSLESLKSNYLKVILFAKENGSSSINLLDNNYFERVFLVLFRPLFYDAQTILQYLVSFENAIWIILFVIFILLLKNKPTVFKSMIFKFLIIYAISVVAFYSIYMYNLGLASRMRVMFMPYAMISLILLSNSSEKEYNNF